MKGTAKPPEEGSDEYKKIVSSFTIFYVVGMLIYTGLLLLWALFVYLLRKSILVRNKWLVAHG